MNSPPILGPILVGIESDVHWGYGIFAVGLLKKKHGQIYDSSSGTNYSTGHRQGNDSARVGTRAACEECASQPQRASGRRDGPFLSTDVARDKNLSHNQNPTQTWYTQNQGKNSEKPAA